MKNAFSIDVEDWFCAYNVSSSIKFEDWDKCESRLARNVKSILEILDQARTKATFFVLGWVAERHPALVKEIEREGHEIASHGYSHRLLTKMQPREFEQDLLMSLRCIGACVSKPIIGFRAPSFTITKETLWAGVRDIEVGVKRP